MKVVHAHAPTLPNAFTLAVHAEGDEFVSTAIATNGVWEPFESEIIFRYLAAHCAPDALFVDCGANLGWYSVGAGLLGIPTLSCEPMPANAALLRENVRRNDLGSLVAIHEVALGAKEGQCTLYLSETNQGDHRLHSGPSTDPAKERSQVQVHMTTLDQLLNGRRPSLIKIDTQGSEVAVLTGGRDAWTPQPGMKDVALVTEFWPYGLARCGSSADEFLNLVDPLIGVTHQCFELSEHQATLTPHSRESLRSLAHSHGLSQEVRGFVNLFFEPIR
jgi:FkbM family methyltransferase